ncbi:hypothetical protein PAXINDRAFT_168996 [Paxillus involutus ATCC 200175]|uniref:DUF6534 domain-containing protein n=1 Tax=Paxillus involutus ATCC 200175 TaxID=664439 RepID=A0A0C9SZE7_PAXIN|nr:hypothetical protein PAXINDRAFT_168996 [Paxillus involutus ATCC 200175]
MDGPILCGLFISTSVVIMIADARAGIYIPVKEVTADAHHTSILSDFMSGTSSGVDSLNLPSDVSTALGYTLSILLYGILIVQAFIYHARFSKDSKWIRIYVWILFGLETLSFAFVLYEMMQGAGIHCLSCIPLSLSTLTLPTWSFEVISILTGLTSLMAHGFYCWRIRVMGRSWYIPIFVMATSLAQCILLSLGTMSDGLLLGSSGISDTWMIANFVCDLIITIETTRLLFRRGATSSFKDTRGLVTKLMRLTIETGAVTTVAMLLQFILSLLDRATAVNDSSEYYNGLWFVNPGSKVLQLSIFYSIPRLYANCLLATLNARLVISKDSTRVHQVSTILFDVPPSTLASERLADNYINVTIGQSPLDVDSFMDTGGDAQTVFVGGIKQEGVSEV